MKIAAVTKLKHGALMQVLEQTGLTAKAFAARVGVGYQHLGRIMRLEARPGPKLRTKIQETVHALGHCCQPDEWWPDYFVPAGKSFTRVAYVEIDPSRLLPEPPTVREEDMLLLEAGMEEVLDERERLVVTRLMQKGQLGEEASDEIGRTRQTVFNVRDDALIKLKEYIEDNRGRLDMPGPLRDQPDMAGSRERCSGVLACRLCGRRFRASPAQLRLSRRTPPVEVYCSAACRKALAAERAVKEAGLEAEREGARVAKQVAKQAAKLRSARIEKRLKWARAHRYRFRLRCCMCNEPFPGTKEHRTKMLQGCRIFCPSCRQQRTMR